MISRNSAVLDAPSLDAAPLGLDSPPEFWVYEQPGTQRYYLLVDPVSIVERSGPVTAFVAAARTEEDLCAAVARIGVGGGDGRSVKADERAVAAEIWSGVLDMGTFWRVRGYGILDASGSVVRMEVIR